MKIYQNKLPIKSWAEADRPREKLLLKGQKSLSDAELIAILLSSGNREESALDLSKRLLNSVNNNLDSLGKITYADLNTFKGIGKVKAICIMAALELGRRRTLSNVSIKPKISASRDVYQLMAPELKDLGHEEFWVLYLNRANLVVKKVPISKGGVSGTTVDAKIIFKYALELLASSMILCHNHPSSNLNPSQADITVTRKLKNAAIALDMEVLDHLIIAGDSYYSFSDEGII